MSEAAEYVVAVERDKAAAQQIAQKTARSMALDCPFYPANTAANYVQNSKPKRQVSYKLSSQLVITLMMKTRKSEDEPFPILLLRLPSSHRSIYHDSKSKFFVNSTVTGLKMEELSTA